jgi:outer membrane protein TolC
MLLAQAGDRRRSSGSWIITAGVLMIMNKHHKNKYHKENTSYMSQIAYTILLLTIIVFSWTNQAVAQNSIPLTLREGLKIVTEESRVVKIAKLSEAIAESDARIARAGLLPSINASAGHTSLAYQPAQLVGGQAIALSDTQYYTYRISIQQILFDFFGSLSRYEASRMLLEAQKLDSTRIRNAVALEFTTAFYDFLESQYFIEAADKEIEQLEAHYRDANEFYKAGMTTRNDLLQVQVRLSDARQKRLSLKNLEAVRAANINNLLQRPLGSECRVVENEGSPAPPAKPNMDGAWDEATNRRVEIRIVDRTIEASDHETTAQKSEFLPKFYVQGSNDYMENPYQRYENNWSLIFGVNINLFEGGRSLANLQKTQGRKKQLIEQRAKLVDEIKLELQRYTLDLHNAYARILANQDAVDQARENLRINKVRYEEGEGTATEVLDAVTLLTTAQTNRIQSIYDYRKAEAATHYAAGMDLLEVYK